MEIFNKIKNERDYKFIVSDDGLGIPKEWLIQIYTEGHTGKNGIAFSINTVRGILTNRAYIGYVKYGGNSTLLFSAWALQRFRTAFVASIELFL